MPVKRGKSKKKNAVRRTPAKKRPKKSGVKTAKRKVSRKTGVAKKRQAINNIDNGIVQPSKENVPELIPKPVAAIAENDPGGESQGPSPIESIFETNSDKDYLPLNLGPPADTAGKTPGTGDMVPDKSQVLEQGQKLNLTLHEDAVDKIAGISSHELNQGPVEAVPNNTRKDNAEPYPRNLSSSAPSMYFMILILVSLILFLLAGYTYPATEEDIAKNRIFWTGSDGKLDRGLFTQFYSSFIFAACVYLMGFYVNSTFVRYGLESWTIFSIGIYMMFLYGLGKIGELTYNHELFGAFNDLILPGALIILAYASYRIFKDLDAEATNGFH